MKPKPTKEKWEKRFDKFWEECNYGYNHIGKNTMRGFIRQVRKEAVRNSFEKGYFRGVLDSEYGQITSEELLKKGSK